MQIIPALIPQTISQISDRVECIVGATDMVQIDMCDGIFVSTVSFPFAPHHSADIERLLGDDEGLPFWDEIEYEFDLMARNASEDSEKWIRMGAGRLVFHVEAEDTLLANLEKLDYFWREKVAIGVAFSRGTDPAVLAPLMPHIDYIQCMGVSKIGYQGHVFDEEVFADIARVKELYPDKLIQVDGAVNAETIVRLRDAGVSRFVVGSAIWKSGNPRDAVFELEDMLRE